ncbi:MAG: HEAT repeat domain-containing protein [Methanosarcinaceae archaeon]|nr:HEAT repeat domain-containing protein [Methanosarcinaceae archaeon]
MKNARQKIFIFFIIFLILGICTGCVDEEKNNKEDIDSNENNKKGNTEETYNESLHIQIENKSNIPAKLHTSENISNIEPAGRLIRSLSNGSHSDKLRSAKALGKLKNQAVDPLIQYLNENSTSNQEINDYALLALAETGEEKTSEYFYKIFEIRNGVQPRTFSSTDYRQGDFKSKEFIKIRDQKEAELKVFISESIEKCTNGTSEDPSFVANEEDSKRKELVQLLCDNKQEANGYAEIALSEITGNEQNDDIEHDKMVELLIEALNNEKNHIRISAIMALGEMREEKAVEPLIDSLSSDNPGIRVVAALALGNIGDKRAVDPLLRNLKCLHINIQYKSSIKSSAALALGKIADERAVANLKQALYDESSSVRRMAALALADIGNKKSAKSIVSIYDERYYQDQNQLSSYIFGENETKTDLILAMGEIKDEKATEVLLKILDDPREGPDIKKTAIFALGEIGNTETTSLIIEIMDDEQNKDEIRKEAILALGKIGGIEIAEALIPMLPDYILGGSVREALVNIGVEAVDPLIKALESDDEKIKVEAAFILIKIGDKKAVAPLIKTFKND